MNFLRNLFDKQQQQTSPKFIEKRQTPSGTYEVYRGNNAESARIFLASKKVDQKQYYIKVETPEGNWGIDIDGLYLERLVPFQMNINSAQCEGSISGIPTMSSLQYAFKGIGDNFVVSIKCGKCNHEGSDGIRYKNPTIVKCPNCRSLNKVDSSPHIVETSGMLSSQLKFRSCANHGRRNQMLNAEITIERPLEIVWAYFTEPRHWEKWWGGGLKAAQWREGGELEWALGGSSPIEAIIPGRMVQIAGSWMSKTFTFEPKGSGKTMVRIQESSPRGGASFSDGGASHLAQLNSSLGKLPLCQYRVRHSKPTI
jgi:uncharacterized protein YndB with AHSA1/START domain